MGDFGIPSSESRLFLGRGTPPWDCVVSACVRLQEAINHSRDLRLNEREENVWRPGEIRPLPDNYWEEVNNWELMYQVLLSACLNCIAQHPEQPFPIGKWRQDLSTLASLPSEVTAFLDVLEGRNADGSPYQEAGAALAALRGGVVAAETLWKASFRLLNAFELQKRWSEKDLEALIANRWIFAAENQSFSFQTPSLAIPTIKAACADVTRTGLAKVAAIVMVAAPYLSIRMAPEAKKMLERIAAG